MTVFETSSTPRVFALPPGCDFAKEFTKGLIERFGDTSPLIMARSEIYLNTGRVKRGLVAAFGEQGTYLLPKMRLVTELASDSRFWDIAPPVPGLRRQLELFQAVSKLLEKDDRFAAQASAFDLAHSLSVLMDEMHAEGVGPDDISKLDVSQHSEHWARSLKFLHIIGQFWCRTDVPDIQARQRMVVERLVDEWKKKPPSHPILVAGSTGSRGATRLLMEAVARLPQGAVILPCFDSDLPEEVWAGMQDSTTGEDHPQFRFKSLFDKLAMHPKDVLPWHLGAKTNPARNRLISLALRPAPVTGQWLTEGPKLVGIKQATKNLTLLEAPHPRAEAVAIAFRLREAAEQGKSAALVTPNSKIARQVRAALTRWHIRPEDSFNLTLSETIPGRLLLLISELFGRTTNAVSLINLLRHPLVHSVHHHDQHHRRVNRLEFHLRRHQKEDEFGDQLERLFREDWHDELDQWNDWLAHILSVLEATQEACLSELAKTHLNIAQFLIAGTTVTEHGENAANEWTMFAGSTALEMMHEVIREGASGGRLDAQSYNYLFASLMRRKSVPKTERRYFPGIYIWDTLDARMQSPDLVIAGGLNEGEWPVAAPTDPWLNRALRSEAGLLMPERKTGLLAHDFQQAIAATEVVLSRSERLASEPSVPARWLIRLTTLLAGIGDEGKSALDAMRKRGQQLLQSSQAMERSHPAIERERRPTPTPPIATRPKQLSVTTIKTLISNPYVIYATRILKLNELNPLQMISFAALRGSIMHQIVHCFVDKVRHDPESCTQENFMATAEAILTPAPIAFHLKRLWLVQLKGMAEEFIAQELERAKSASPVALETQGKIQLPDTKFVLTARCDRIDRLHDGGALAVYDYKTGTIPSMAEIRRRDKQIPLTVKMLEFGGFLQFPTPEIAEAAYIKIGKSTEVKTVDKELFDQTWDRLIYLIKRFEDPKTGYISRLNMHSISYDEAFDHLARYGEWDEFTETLGT